MKEPKFKHGDTVRFKNGGETFTIIRIEYSILKNYFTYSDDRLGGWDEELELYQEPKKKAAYAYTAKDTGRKIEFMLDNCPYGFSVLHDNGKLAEWKRAPEYDIEYPSEEVK